MQIKLKLSEWTYIKQKLYKKDNEDKNMQTL
jgi:hypothetical protein